MDSSAVDRPKRDYETIPEETGRRKDQRGEEVGGKKPKERGQRKDPTRREAGGNTRLSGRPETRDKIQHGWRREAGGKTGHGGRPEVEGRARVRREEGQRQDPRGRETGLRRPETASRIVGGAAVRGPKKECEDGSRRRKAGSGDGRPIERGCGDRWEARAVNGDPRGVAGDERPQTGSRY